MGILLISTVGLVSLLMLSANISATSPVISGSLWGAANKVATLVCKASNENPVMNLKWTVDGRAVSGRYKVISSGNTQNTLSLTLSPGLDQKEVKCIGTQNTANGVVISESRGRRVTIGTCSLTRPQGYSCPYYKSVTYKTSSASCRSRWWRRRCSTSYGRATKKQRVGKLCYKTVTYCCSGWSGSACYVNANRPPTVSNNCPSRKTVRTSLGQTTVLATWSKPRFYVIPSSDGITVTSTYNGEKATLSFGSHKIRYNAKNNKNGKQSSCEFTVDVLPALPKPEIKDYNNGDMIEGTEGDVLNFECVAEYGNPAMELTWIIGGVQQDGEFTKVSAGYGSFENSKNTLQLNLASDHNNTALQCKGSYGGSDTVVQVTLRVKADSPPLVDYCPTDITNITSDAPLTVTWSAPTFFDPGNAPLTITNNLPDSTNVQDFPYGKHEIIYTATNANNGKKASCSFFVTVSPTPPAYPSPPVDGATACGAWFSETLGFPHVCLFMCDDTNGIYTNQQLNEMSLWTSTTGTWISPLLSPVTCTANVDGSIDRLNANQHYTGQCSPISADIQTKFREIIQNSHFSGYCQETNCSDAAVTVNCG